MNFKISTLFIEPISTRLGLDTRCDSPVLSDFFTLGPNTRLR